MEQQEITVYAAITISGPLVYHLIRWNVTILILHELCHRAPQTLACQSPPPLESSFVSLIVGFLEEYAKFLAVALPWVISGTGASHVLMPLSD
jgi:RsiW-degrading membrane proteinase PrsW (M82 family)